MNRLDSDFSLHFDGFQTDSPDALREFKALCLTDLDMSVEDTVSILSSRGERVLCRRGSVTELERLAVHFRAIGARVDIRGPIAETTRTAPPPSEVDRIFADTNPLESSGLHGLYESQLSERAEPVVSHFSGVEHIEMPRARPVHATAQQSNNQFLGFLAACGVASLLAAAGVVNALLDRTPPQVSHLTSSAYVVRQKIEQASTMALNAPAETVSWAGSLKHAEQGYNIQLSALQVADVLSMRMTIANTAEPTIPTSINELRLRRAESDPGVLRRVSADKWLGDVPVYLFLERGEERLRLVGTAHVTVTGSSALTAHISVAYPELEANKADEPKGMALWQDASGGYRFSLSETIELKR